MAILFSAWRILASLRTTAIIALAMAGLAVLAAVIPQGPEALTIASYEHSDTIQGLAAWGFTNVFQSAWMKALWVLLAGNVLAVVLSVQSGFGADSALELPDRAAEETKLEVDRPESAVETLRETFRSVLGAAPRSEWVDGARVTMAFDAGARAGLAPLWAHLGLILLVVGAAWASTPPPQAKTAVRAVLEVRDSRTNTTGLFDMVEGETFQFFQWRARYIVRDYAASKDGLGPAVRIERLFPDQQRRDDFWVYAGAPPEFDARHRRGFVAVVAKKIGLLPVPGAGLASSSAATLLLIGFGLLLYGAAVGQGAQGRLWVDVDGKTVRLAGAPLRAGDPQFQRAFRRWDLVARSVLAE